MSSTRRCLMLGAGGMARTWIRDFLPLFADRLQIVGLVDVDERELAASGETLGLQPSQRFTQMAAAFASVEAEMCIIVIPPAYHREAVLYAVERGMAILSEKPIADTWPACLDIYAAVTGAGIKMQVIQNYRYTVPMLTMRHVLTDGDLGRINYIMARFAADYREYGAWGALFRHEMQHALLIEGAVHHFDMLRNLCGGDCAYLSGWEWNPPWSESKGQFCNLFAIQMSNDVRANYEGSGTAGGAQNSWRDEYYRAECERGTVSVGRDHVVRIQRYKRGGNLVTEEVAPIVPQYREHAWQIDEFLTWLDGGPAPATVIEDNIKTVAMVFAAIEASRTNSVVDVAAMVRAAAQPS